MKNYENEESFVKSFAKDCKQGIKDNGKFEAEINGIQVVVTGMDNNNASKVTIYQGSVNGASFQGSITALKKRLNITYTKEYNRSAEASTKVTVKTDAELEKTAETAARRVQDAINVIRQASRRYGLSRADMFERADNVEGLILEALKQQRDKVAKERADKEAQQAAEAAKKEVVKREILRRIAEASANADMAEVIRLTSDLKKYM